MFKHLDLFPPHFARFAPCLNVREVPQLKKSFPFHLWSDYSNSPQYQELLYSPVKREMTKLDSTKLANCFYFNDFLTVLLNKRDTFLLTRLILVCQRNLESVFLQLAVKSGSSGPLTIFKTKILLKSYFERRSNVVIDWKV